MKLKNIVKLFACVIFFCQIGSAQKFDSIEKELKKFDINSLMNDMDKLHSAEPELMKLFKKDSVRADICYALALIQLKKNNSDSSLYFINTGMVKSVDGKDSLKFKILLSEISLKKERPQDVINHFKDFDENRFPFFLSYNHYLLGRAYFMLNDYENAGEHFEKLLSDVRYSKIADEYIKKMRKLEGHDQ